MPTYEFRCPEGHDFEKFYRKISDAPSEVSCPECGAVAERRMSAGAGLLFKGSGFYITDYGKDGKGARKDSAPEVKSETKSESTSGDAKPAGDSKSGAKADSAPAPKPEPKKPSGGTGGSAGGAA
jgi:putative FmdB family regulatory protein